MLHFFQRGGGRVRRWRGRKGHKGLLAGAALVGLVLLYVTANAVSIWTFRAGDQTQRADVAIVLGAAVWEGEVSPVYAARLDHAVALYQGGYVKDLIVTGGVGEGNDTPDAWAARDYAVAHGVPQADVLVEDTSTITQENLENAKVMMDAQGLRTALIVSDPLHMRRSMLLARDAGLIAYSSPTTFSRYTTWRTKLPFLARETFFYIGYKWWRLLP